MTKELIDMNKAELAEQYEAQIGYNPFLDDPSIGVETVRDTLIDHHVESIGMIGAMEMHPREFTADEIIAEFNADNLGRMTEEMAIIINTEYCIDEMEDWEITELSANVYYVADHAKNML